MVLDVGKPGQGRRQVNQAQVFGNDNDRGQWVHDNCRKCWWTGKCAAHAEITRATKPLDTAPGVR